ncbi:MAG: MFS transporter, partial [Kiritimatiellia bacterium]
GPVSFYKLLQNKGFLMAVFILLAVRFANTIVNPSFPLIIRDILDSQERLNSVTGMIMAFAGLTGAISAGLLGYVGDRFGHRRIVIVCSIGTGITAVAHIMADSVFSLTVIHLLFGAAVSGTLPAVNAMIRNHSDPRHMGKAFGAASAISMLGLAIGPLTGGLLAKTFDIRTPFIFAGICQLIVVATTWRSRITSGPDDSKA